MVVLSAQGMPVAKIAEVTFTSAERIRDVIPQFNADGLDSLYPKYKGGQPKTFTLPESREIKKIAKSKPPEHDLPFSTWSLTKLADFLVAEGMLDDISHEGLCICSAAPTRAHPSELTPQAVTGQTLPATAAAIRTTQS
ncbi:hypothetical protein BJ965_007702 [Streptomyces luteogriseus]|uniref:Transposase n=1 Tax=Streptomyces luteogriseus TaxID=68233 RepID=A0A7W7DVZ0_9ACTN|nr:hypothetical protein [Streptomyces luteogriseus]